MCTLLWAKLPGSSAKLPGPSCAKAGLGLQISQLLPHSLTNIQDLFIVKGADEVERAYLRLSSYAKFRSEYIGILGRQQQLDLSASFIC